MKPYISAVAQVVEAVRGKRTGSGQLVAIPNRASSDPRMFQWRIEREGTGDA